MSQQGGDSRGNDAFVSDRRPESATKFQAKQSLEMLLDVDEREYHTLSTTDAPELILNRLKSLIDDIESFFEIYVGELAELLDAATTQAPAPAHNGTTSFDFAKERAAWERLRCEQEENLRQKFQYLTDAWLRLEEEQRRFLQARDSRVRSSPGGSSPRNQSDFEDAVDLQEDSLQAKFNQNSHSERRRITDNVDCNLPTAHPLTESAILQFERLKKEINLSRPNRVERKKF